MMHWGHLCFSQPVLKEGRCLLLGHGMCVNSEGSLNFSGLQLAHPFGSISFFKIFSFAHLGSAVIFHVIEWKTYTEKNNFS